MMSWIVYGIGGIFSGTLAGLLGIGGGIVIIPLLTWLLPYDKVPPQAVMHVAVASSLAIVVGTSLSSIYAHNAYRSIQWSLVSSMFIGLLGGGVLGVLVATHLPSDILKIIFSLFLLVMAYLMFFLLPVNSLHSHKLWSLLGVSSFSSFLATMVGVGGGSILVPFFTHCGIEMRKSIATSAACTFVISLTAVISYMVVGTGELDLPYSTGYVYWIPVIGFLFPSILCAPLGVRLAHKISPRKLRGIFGLFLLFVSFHMLGDAIHKIG